MSARLAIILAAALGAMGVAGSVSQAAAPALNFETFKTQVEPVFLKKREGIARCYQCHGGANNAFGLQELGEGQTGWTEEQSLLNFATASALVTPGDPDNSRLLLHPLAPEGGGDLFHSGGRQFESKNDPDWKAIADWVNGQ
jgi:hypothetical protein